LFGVCGFLFALFMRANILTVLFTKYANQNASQT
jgi:hypothetical protein